MIKFLENLLYEKTKGTQSEILFAQWNYDKKVIPSALNAVSILFPHYSLHDESHSITIINNIVRVLGKNKLEKLSAIDLWLILEASYCHDIGMVVSNEKLTESLKSKDFLDFFKELMQDKKNSLFEFANLFEIIENKIQYKLNELNFELHDGIKFILAEYFRRKHADRSEEIIINPIGELNISTPRGVIPQRLFKILGNICSSHTKSFQDVMDLPFCEVGIDIEDAHPRFISCLLRIGDLLDLDNNRFSEVMLRTLSRIPIDTINHKAKHLSIESFRVDNEKIEVSAKCSDYDTATITQHWFNYLNSEISNQMINWNNIVPYKEFGYLPTIGNLKVELENYDYIDGKKKPKFAVDTDKALELLQGTGLYEGAYQCIREILQNSVDAALIRIWLEHKEDSDLKTPQSIDFKKIVKNYPIEIQIKEKEVIGDNKIWEFSIQDNGIGISSYDLNFLMNTGSSSKNIKKSNLIDSMPVWLRPSGIFGIGFQSVFMLTDQVNIDTKSFFTEEFQSIELNSPNSKKDGGILIQKKKTNHRIKPGTKINFLHKTKAIPDRWSIKGEQKIASRIARNYDPFTSESLDIELGKTIDEIFDFAHKSYIPIIFKIDNNIIQTTTNDNSFKYFDDDNSLELSINTSLFKNKNKIVTYYKNQEVTNDLNLLFLGFEINIHKDKATEVLTLNRNKVKSEYDQYLHKQFFQSAFKILISNFNEIFPTDELKGVGSVFLNYYHDLYNFQKEFDIKRFNQWKKLKIEVTHNGIIKNIEINKLINIDSLKIIYNKYFSGKFGDNFKLDGKVLEIEINGYAPSNNITYFIFQKVEKLMSLIEINEFSDEKIKTISFSKKKTHYPIQNSEVSTIIKNIKKTYYSSRCIIPCIEKYSNLRLETNAHEGYVHEYRLDYNINIEFPKMLSPFISVEDENQKTSLKIILNDKLYDWVFENRFNENVTLEEIKKSYAEFINEFKIEELNKLDT